jgi:hypothetical protein
MKWEKWMSENPAHIETVRLARYLILALEEKFRNTISVSDESIAGNVARIVDSLPERQKIKIRRSYSLARLLPPFKVAAVMSVCCPTSPYICQWRNLLVYLNRALLKCGRKET